MNIPLASIDPFYAACLNQLGSGQHDEPRQPVYARLPMAPINASPVPHLTSLYHFDRTDDYGRPDWPGNCGGQLIKDLLMYFRPKGIVLDPMSGSGTCRDVCRALGIACYAWDIHDDFDACNPNGFP